MSEKKVELVKTLAAPYELSRTYKFDPFAVRIDELNRGRVKPPTQDQLVQMAISLSEHGQIDPISFHLCQDEGFKGVPTVTAGYTRLAAARLLREGFRVTKEIEVKKDDGSVEVSETVVEYKDPDFQIEARLTHESDMDAFLRNIVSNAHRNQTTVIDDAHNQDRLRRAPFNYTDRKIAELFSMTPARVSQLKAYLDMDTDLQDMISAGQLSGVSAELLMQLPKAKRQHIVDKILEGVKVPPSEIKAEVREWLNNDAARAEFTKAHNAPAASANGEAPAATGDGAAPAPPAETPGKRGRKGTDTQGDTTKMSFTEIMTELKYLASDQVKEHNPRMASVAQVFRDWFLGKYVPSVAWQALAVAVELGMPDYQETKGKITGYGTAEVTTEAPAPAEPVAS